MKVIRAEDVPFEKHKARAREGGFEFRRILEGASGEPDNFVFRMTRLSADYTSPRHKHNFEQFRLVLEGTADFARDGKLKSGMIGYFPEGTPYGPQSSDAECLILALQFGGASGQGYVSPDQYSEAAVELKKIGEFKDGVFTITGPDGQKKNTDGFQAVWEQVNQRRMEYPKPRYNTPIFMEPDNFAWRTSEGQQGVAKKHMGTFTECGTGVDLHRLAAGVELELEPHSIYFVLSGSGKAGQEKWLRYTTLHVGKNQRPKIRAEEDAEIYHIRLPDLSAYKAQEKTAPVAMAS
jgi:mannose-6-phosphate isomerase-like protein (cupin superfamily)